MNQDKRYVAVSALTLLLLGVLLAGFETAFWPMLIPFLPKPLVCLSLIIYVSLYRGKYEGFLTAYLLAFGFSWFSVQPPGLLVATAGILFLVLRAVKSRVYSPGPFYFVVACVLSIPIFYLVQIAISNVAEDSPLSSFHIFRWIGEMGTTAFASFLLYHVIVSIDRFVRGEAGDEVVEDVR